MSMLTDGFSSIITFANVPTIKLYEKDVTPPGLEMGGPIDITTMRNTAYRTFAPKTLKTLTQGKSTVAFDTTALPILKAQLGLNQPITFLYPDNSSCEFWGYIESFGPATHKDGEQPTMEITIQPTLRNGAGTEIAPVWAASGAS